jgi:tetratricopeptide (TPR) repeat protein
MNSRATSASTCIEDLKADKKKGCEHAPANLAILRPGAHMQKGKRRHGLGFNRLAGARRLALERSLQMARITLTLPEALKRAIAAYNDGKFSEAEGLCRAIIAAKPDCFDALHLLAVLQTRLGRLKNALTSYDLALRVRPDCAEALSNRGATFHELKRFDEALACFDQALALRPDYAEALHNRGLTLHELKRFDEALASYEQALALRPDYAEALHNRGLTLYELKRFSDALASFDQALVLRPDYAEALHNRGLTLHELKRFDETLASYEQALALRPNYAEALHNRGLTLYELKRFSDALASFEQTLALRPDYAEALHSRGVTLHRLKRFDEALVCFDQALALRPDYPETLRNRGLTLHELKRFGEALASYEQALALRPNYAEALHNRGVSLHELKRFDEALASYEQALALRPDYAQVDLNEAICRLLIGDFDRGWEKFDRYFNRYYQFRRLTVSKGTAFVAIAGNAILLHARQGFGDTMQFSRYVPLVANLAKRVILEVEAPLHGLMSTLPGAAQIVARGEPLPDFDIQCPLESLPLAFGTRLETIPSATPYLGVSSQAMMNWNARLGGPRNCPKIGLAWSGNPMNWNDQNRSVRLASLLRLLDLNSTFVSLQKDVRADDAAVLKARSDVLHFGDELKDFSDTAAIISNLDLVISVDSSIVHLAGALAKPVWVMLPFIPDWRWLLDREDSPWYPTARLFRQDDSRSWESVILRVHVALQDFVRNYFSKPTPAACSA